MLSSYAENRASSGVKVIGQRLDVRRFLCQVLEEKSRSIKNGHALAMFGRRYGGSEACQGR